MPTRTALLLVALLIAVGGLAFVTAWQYRVQQYERVLDEANRALRLCAEREVAASQRRRVAETARGGSAPGGSPPPPGRWW